MGHDWTKCNCPEHWSHWTCSKCGISYYSSYDSKPSPNMVVRKHLNLKLSGYDRLNRVEVVKKGTGKPGNFAYFTCEEWIVEQVSTR